MFFYCWMYGRFGEQPKTTPLQPGIYAVRNLFKEVLDASIKYTPAQSEPVCVEDFRQFAEPFEEALRCCLDRLFDPTVPFTQASSPKGCLYCLFKSLCGR